MKKCKRCKKLFQPKVKKETLCPTCTKYMLLLRKKIRRIWKIKPVTKIKESDKKYNRKKAKDKLRKDKET